MANTLTSFLQSTGTYLDSEQAIWLWNEAELHLKITYYLTRVLPNVNDVTSVRGILLKDKSVLTLSNRDGTQHIIPGGRIEPGETLLATLSREILEETGWTFTQPQWFGVIHYQHLTSRPEGYPYPYPDFLQVIYTIQADQYKPEAKHQEDYEQQSRFLPVSDALMLPIADGQKACLRHILATLNNSHADETS